MTIHAIISENEEEERYKKEIGRKKKEMREEIKWKKR